MTFAKPCFEVPERLAEFGRRFYDAIAPGYPIDLSAMQAFGGTSFADTGLEGRLLAGNLRFVLRPANFDVEIRSADAGDSLDYAKNFIATCRNVVDDIIPRTQEDTCSVSLGIWFKLRDGAGGAAKLLDKQTPPVVSMLTTPNRRVISNLDLRLFINEPSIECVWRCEPSVFSSSDLFVSFMWTARGELAIADVEMQASAMDSEFRAVTNAIGLELAR